MTGWPSVSYSRQSEVNRLVPAATYGL